MTRLTIALFAGLLGCDPAAPPSPPLAPKAPGLQVTGKQINVGVKAYRFSLAGSGCRSIHAALYHLSAERTNKVTSMDFMSLPEQVTGDLWLTEMTGEPFGKSAVLSYSLGETVSSSSSKSDHGAFPLIEGAFPRSPHQFHTAGSLSSGEEAVIFARCMGKNLEEHRFGAGSLDQLKQHVQETKDIVVVVTLRWERN